ncbi:MAG: PEP-CTERM sorting domain-containing protein [Desulfuromonadaceae bacterium]|nr:PEP-CTERM sorting domain-containing protein [Desulfuromonadaceae bacterium]MDD5104810.1 PEP-CTERM sorting domain-containing protein [Desulfuromonadaceae bacterium]
MKRTALAVGFIAAMGFSQIAQATTVTDYADKALNWATWTATANNASDPLGTPSITSTSVTMDDYTLKQIQFKGAGIAAHLDSVYSGDLFIDANADQTWDYVVRGLGNTLETSTPLSLDLYSFAAPIAIHASDTYALSSYNPFNSGNTDGSANYNIRSGLPVGLLESAFGRSTDIGDVMYTSTNSAITFDFAAYQSALTFGSDFIIGYAVTCANDVVYQEVPVPEPGTIALLGLGMLGLAVFGKRRMGKNA